MPCCVIWASGRRWRGSAPHRSTEAGGHRTAQRGAVGRPAADERHRLPQRQGYDVTPYRLMDPSGCAPSSSVLPCSKTSSRTTPPMTLTRRSARRQPFCRNGSRSSPNRIRSRGNCRRTRLDRAPTGIIFNDRISLQRLEKECGEHWRLQPPLSLPRRRSWLRNVAGGGARRPEVEALRGGGRRTGSGVLDTPSAPGLPASAGPGDRDRDLPAEEQEPFAASGRAADKSGRTWRARPGLPCPSRPDPTVPIRCRRACGTGTT